MISQLSSVEIITSGIHVLLNCRECGRNLWGWDNKDNTMQEATDAVEDHFITFAHNPVEKQMSDMERRVSEDRIKGALEALESFDVLFGTRLPNQHAVEMLDEARKILKGLE